MREHEPAKNDRRRARRAVRLGPDAACVVCGEQRPETLTRVSRSFLEEHHIAGIQNDPDLTGVLCLNCHRKVTEGMLDLGTPVGPPRTLVDTLIALLCGLAAFFQVLADSLAAYAARLRALREGLDRDAPAWRAVAEAA